ncbi:hypothetical protein QFC19_007318 [Naganishia cerealis]|uniref:Uncharacterized protein n=1 Tax=Naganishia cerealis TaxID=610337 RepID=A0ACC2VBZ4_9TREE|nr:hypothetical protein QFC19_007318 [Naganishia cerealis]
MMHKLRKRRPSEPQPRPAPLPRPTAGLQDLPISQGDFRGSVIIDSLSKRFSVLRAKASPIRSTFPTAPFPSHLDAIDDIRQRLAAQRDRERQRGTDRYIAPDEETLVLDELISVVDDDDGDGDGYYPPSGRVMMPRSASERTPTTYHRFPAEAGPQGSRTYGFGATAGMKEADVLIRAHADSGKRSVGLTSIGSGAAAVGETTPPPTTSDYQDGTQGIAGKEKRKSLLAMLPVETQERIAYALLQIEEDLLAEGQETMMDSPHSPQPTETLSANTEERQWQQVDAPPPPPSSSSMTTPQKRPHHVRQNSSITRSPFTENLAQIANGISTGGEPVTSVHSASHSRTASSATSSIQQPALPAPADGTLSGPSSRRSSASRAGTRRHSRTAGRSVDMTRFRFGSGGSSTGVERNETTVFVPVAAVSPPPQSALPPIPTSPPYALHGEGPLLSPSYRESTAHQTTSSVVSGGSNQGVPLQSGKHQHQHQHQRTPSASAAVIPTTSFETGYIPGSARPFTASGGGSCRVSAESPLDRVGNHNHVNPDIIDEEYKLPSPPPLTTTAPPLVRKPSKVIPPNRPGPLTLKPTLMVPRSATVASALPSVSPVVATFADSATRKGYAVIAGDAPYLPLEGSVPGRQVSSLDVDPAGGGSGMQGESPLEVSFDIDGYYGHGRSPVDSVMQYSSIEPEAREWPPATTDPLRLASQVQRERNQPARSSNPAHNSSQGSPDTLRNTFPLARETLPSPDPCCVSDLAPPPGKANSGSIHPFTAAEDFSDDDAAEGGDDEHKHERFDELQAMQERLVEAAREVRRGLIAGTHGNRGESSRKDVSPGLRARPSLRTPKSESSEYADTSDNVSSQLVRALSARQAADPSARSRGSVLQRLHSVRDQATSRSAARAAEAVMNHSNHVGQLASPFQEQQKSPEMVTSSEPSPQTPQQSMVTPRASPLHVYHDDTAAQDLEARTRLAKALFDSDHRSNDMSNMDQPTGPAPSSVKSKAEKDAEIRRDFEARIAQATAQLNQSPSIRVKRKPSTKGRNAMHIGEPTLIDASSNLRVMPLPKHAEQDLSAALPAGSVAKHDRHQSSSAIHNENSTGSGGGGGSGFKNFVAKIKRNASLAERKRAKTPGSSPRIGQSSFQPLAPVARPAQMSDSVQTPSDVLSPNAKDEQPSSDGTADPTQEALPLRKALVRRTIIYSTVNDNHNEVTASQGEPTVPSASSPTRRPSTRRKPVRHLSGDTEIFRAEGLLDPSQSQSISQVLSTSGAAEGASEPRKSSADSLYDMYADTPDPNLAEEGEEIIYTGNGSSFVDDGQATARPKTNVGIVATWQHLRLG